MICQSCEKVAATFHLTEIVEGEKKEVHLCELCAKNQGVSPFSVASLLSELGGTEIGSPAGGEPGVALECPHCGLEWDEFRARGRLGCPHDYEAFRPALVPLLEKIHGATQHIGKVPARLGQEMAVEKELIDRRRELLKAVQQEDYERAARLRDEIQKLETSRGSEPAPAAEDADDDGDQ